MRRLKSEKGIALITTLMLLVLGFSLVATLLYFVTAETKIARLEQNYATALDAAKGGADMFIFMVQNNVPSPPNPGIGGASPHGGNCTKVKMNVPTSSWCTALPPLPDWAASGCPTNGCANAPPIPTVATNPDPTTEPDVTITLSGYTVSMKVIDTYKSDKKTPPFPPLPADPPCVEGCLWYTVAVRATSPVGGDHADITFVYRYDM